MFGNKKELLRRIEKLEAEIAQIRCDHSEVTFKIRQPLLPLVGGGPWIKVCKKCGWIKVCKKCGEVLENYLDASEMLKAQIKLNQERLDSLQKCTVDNQKYRWAYDSPPGPKPQDELPPHKEILRGDIFIHKRTGEEYVFMPDFAGPMFIRQQVPYKLRNDFRWEKPPHRGWYQFYDYWNRRKYV